MARCAQLGNIRFSRRLSDLHFSRARYGVPLQMTGYAIQRDDGALFCEPGQNGGRCWTHNIRRVKRYYTREAAAQNCCPENERAISLDDLLAPMEF